MPDDVCEMRYADEKKIRPIRKLLDQPDTIERLAETFRVLGDPNRLKIIYALSKIELCVCDISALLGSGESAVSHQLRLLRALRLVKYRREGKMAYYSLDDKHIQNLFDEGLRHVKEEIKGR